MVLYARCNKKKTSYAEQKSLESVHCSPTVLLRKAWRSDGQAQSLRVAGMPREEAMVFTFGNAIQNMMPGASSWLLWGSKELGSPDKRKSFEKRQVTPDQINRSALWFKSVKHLVTRRADKTAYSRRTFQRTAHHAVGDEPTHLLPARICIFHVSMLSLAHLLIQYFGFYWMCTLNWKPKNRAFILMAESSKSLMLTQRPTSIFLEDLTQIPLVNLI